MTADLLADVPAKPRRGPSEPRVLAGSERFVPVKPRRKSKYDALLDGRLREVGPACFPWFVRRGRTAARLAAALRKGRAATAARARLRGLRLLWQEMEDGALAVQAVERGNYRRGLDLTDERNHP